MSRKRSGLGGLMGLAAVLGAGAAVVSYLYRYQKFSEEVDQDFTDVVDSANEMKDTAKRSYTTLKSSMTSEELKTAAKDLGYAAKNLAIDTKNLAVDAGKDAYKTVREALDSKHAKDEDVVDEDADDAEIEVEFYEELDEENAVEPEDTDEVEATDSTEDEADVEEVTLDQEEADEKAPEA